MVIKVLRKIQPTYMGHIVGVLYLKNILHTKGDDILTITMIFLKKSLWNDFPRDENLIKITKPNVKLPKTLNELFSNTNIFTVDIEENIVNKKSVLYPKQQIEPNTHVINQSQIIHILYITFECFLDAFSLHDVQNTLESMNESINENGMQLDSNTSTALEINSSDSEKKNLYFVTEHFIKKYRYIYENLKELIILFSQLKKDNKLCDHLSIFSNVLDL